ncbi:sortase-associated OmpA-like protein PdsO [Alteromonas pelagimontana]|uniref:Sortase-associated OmpA-like protein PdsO n=1 Tax=Alteromonas pelagimontana TaxID=1858656 RepID=A0A6M4MEY4_9ALTE|nr:sortase-associated OmpA-like protein PdsO [Alteromonas pelagimontana]QJR81428.1 sortase-associated OmpA-like protein PdsO [Alteromonas pelagimontana]
MKATQRSTIIALPAAIVLTLTPSWAFAKNSEQDKAVAIGLGSGAAVGAVIAGPIGAAVGGILGAMMGNDTAQKDQLKGKTLALSANEQALSATQQELFAMRDALQAMEQEAKATNVAFIQDTNREVMAVESNIQFTTGSATIEQTYFDQLDLVAEALKLHKQLQVRLIGHADNRGASQFNQALSMQRALQVQNYLIEKGVNNEQILTVAVGEKESAGDSMEKAFFDRKVVMQIADGEAVLTANR